MCDGDNSKRRRRGILGVPYPKKDQRLFSFTPVQGDEWSSSDDSDEDFEVKYCSRDSDEEEAPRRRKHKKSGKRSSKGKSKRSKREKPKSKNGQVAQEVDIASWDCLPVIIIQRVLHFVIEDDGAVPFLLRASRVSRNWREAAKSSLLWRHVNLDSSRLKLDKSKKFEGLRFLTANRFSRLEHFNLSNWANLNLTTLESVLQKCPTIKQLTLQGCSKLGSSCLANIADKCEHLVAVDITGVVPPGQCLSSNSVSHLLSTRGSRLEELVLARNAFNKWPRVLDPIMRVNSMPQLRHLDLSNCEFKSRSMPVLPVESLHSACPNLEVLLLASCDLIGTQEEQHVKEASPGFPKLQELHFPFITCSSTLCHKQQDLIERILKASVDLRFLDIRGRILFKLDFVENLPCTDVEFLYIGRSDTQVLPLIRKLSGKWLNDEDNTHIHQMGTKNGSPRSRISWITPLPRYNLKSSQRREGELSPVIIHNDHGQGSSYEWLYEWLSEPTKWSHSLKTLEMANLNTGDDDGSSIVGLLPSMGTVQNLDLAGTEIASSYISQIFQHCKSLTELNLERCRNIDRGMKQKFQGERLEELARKCSGKGISSP